MNTVQDDSTCPVCCDAYTRQKRSKVTCNYCLQGACKPCYSTFLLSESQSNCMHCRTPWNRDFIVANFTRAFYNGPLKKRREDILFGIEEALLPATQDHARAELERRERRRDLNQVDNIYRQVRKRMHNIALRIYEINQTKHKSGHTLTPHSQRELRTELVNLRVEYGRVSSELAQLRAQRSALYNVLLRNEQLANNQNENVGEDQSDINAKKEKKSFIRRCPVEECKGFLSTRYQCGLCHIKVCPDCLEVKDENEHTCNPDTVATVQLLKKDTCGCPNCGVQIHKIDGCDQMWCVSCHTAFSWRTGKIETGRVHNPHWFEWQRQRNNGQIPREVGDDPCHNVDGCPIPQLAYLPYNIDYRIIDTIRALTHIYYVEVRHLPRDNIQEDRNRDLRVKYLLNEINKEALKRTLQAREKKRDKLINLRQILDVCIQASGDILNQHIQEVGTSAENTIKQLDELRVYINNCLTDLAKRFDCSVRKQIDARWRLVSVGLNVDNTHQNYFY